MANFKSKMAVKWNTVLSYVYLNIIQTSWTESVNGCVVTAELDSLWYMIQKITYSNVDSSMIIDVATYDSEDGMITARNNHDSQQGGAISCLYIVLYCNFINLKVVCHCLMYNCVFLIKITLFYPARALWDHRSGAITSSTGYQGPSRAFCGFNQILAHSSTHCWNSFHICPCDCGSIVRVYNHNECRTICERGCIDGLFLLGVDILLCRPHMSVFPHCTPVSLRSVISAFTRYPPETPHQLLQQQ